MNEISRSWINRAPLVKNLDNRNFVFIGWENVENVRKIIFNCTPPEDLRINSISASYRINVQPIFFNLNVEGLRVEGANLSISIEIPELCNVTYSPNQMYDILGSMNGGELLVTEYEILDGTQYDTTTYEFSSDEYGFLTINKQVSFNKMFVDIICPAEPIIRAMNFSWRYENLYTYSLSIEKVLLTKT